MQKKNESGKVFIDKDGRLFMLTENARCPLCLWNGEDKHIETKSLENKKWLFWICPSCGTEEFTQGYDKNTLEVLSIPWRMPL